ncbi:MAG TPA: tRNA epoxyqueuosine(34) reductase QueG [Gemmatimonadaceae bacterium]
MTVSAATTSLEVRIKQRAHELGFDPVGVTRLGPAATHDAFVRWLARGYAGEMSYLPRGAEKRRDTTLPFPGVRSAVVVALNYGGKQPAGSVARYARGDDYHNVMLARLEEMHRWLEAECGRSIKGKAYVDTGPILERDLAQRAGLGWIGKNTMLINPTRGSFFFLGALLVDLELDADAPFEADRCGSCTRCLDACPTGAFVAPHVMDARRCISYLTIEHRSEIAAELQPLMGELIYGCDICQDVCPWNHKFATEAGDPALTPRPENVDPDPSDLVELTDEEFRVRFAGSPIKRAKRQGMARNAAIAIANRGDPDTGTRIAKAPADD